MKLYVCYSLSSCSGPKSTVANLPFYLYVSWNLHGTTVYGLRLKYLRSSFLYSHFSQRVVIGTYSQAVYVFIMHACIISPHFDVWLLTCFTYARKCIRASWCTEMCGFVSLGSALLLLANTIFLSIKRRRLTCLNTERTDHYPRCLVSKFQQEKRLKVGHDYGISHMISNPPSMNTKSSDTESET